MGKPGPFSAGETNDGIVPYDTFLRQSGNGPIAQRERELVRETSRMPVLCPSLFLPVDYFGNKDGAFDGIAGTERSLMPIIGAGESFDSPAPVSVYTGTVRIPFRDSGKATPCGSRR